MAVVYDGLWALMAKKKIRKHYLRLNGVHATTVDRMLKGGCIDTRTIGALCRLLDCQPGDILTYIPDDPGGE